MEKFIFYFKEILNNKKALITISVSLFIIAISMFLLGATGNNNDDDNTAKYSNPTIYNKETNSISFFDANRTVSLELSKNYNLKNYLSLENYLIELRSDSDLNIFVSSKNLINGKTLKEVVSADKLAYTENFNSVSNISEIKEITINDNNIYTYSFHYLDSNLNTSFYIQISWLEKNNSYYIFDIEFPLNDLSNYTDIINDVLYSFKTL